jgi:hypothetical protein
MKKITYAAIGAASVIALGGTVAATAATTASRQPQIITVTRTLAVYTGISQIAVMTCPSGYKVIGGGYDYGPSFAASGDEVVTDGPNHPGTGYGFSQAWMVRTTPLPGISSSNKFLGFGFAICQRMKG